MPPGSKTLNAVRSELSLSMAVLTMLTPCISALRSAGTVSALARMSPCTSPQATRTD